MLHVTTRCFVLDHSIWCLFAASLQTTFWNVGIVRLESCAFATIHWDSSLSSSCFRYFKIVHWGHALGLDRDWIPIPTHWAWPIRTVTFPSRSISLKLHSNGARFQWTSIASDFNPDALGMADPHSHISIQVDFIEASFQWSSFPMDFHCIGLQSRRIGHGLKAESQNCNRPAKTLFLPMFWS